VTAHAERRTADGLRWGVEPICRVLSEHGTPIAPSTCYDTYYDAVARDRRRASAVELRDGELTARIARVHAENYGVYGARKVWLALNREGTPVARCTVERLMRGLGLQGARRGTPRRTTITDPAAARPGDLVQRRFSQARPDAVWVADFTYVATGWLTARTGSGARRSRADARVLVGVGEGVGWTPPVSTSQSGQPAWAQVPSMTTCRVPSGRPTASTTRYSGRLNSTQAGARDPLVTSCTARGPSSGRMSQRHPSRRRATSPLPPGDHAEVRRATVARYGPPDTPEIMNGQGYCDDVVLHFAIPSGPDVRDPCPFDHAAE
jgi:putative transposase